MPLLMWGGSGPEGTAPLTVGAIACGDGCDIGGPPGAIRAQRQRVCYIGNRKQRASDAVPRRNPKMSDVTALCPGAMGK
ncbi:MAG: hypothetical protein GDA48_24085 [Hormoscilla sp. GM102CHS1]|nr:hypothetical protein [Hormoscilla sp. GM102CHS1]